MQANLARTPLPKLRAIALIALSCVLATQASAQGSGRSPRKKPFEALSQSAQRLKDSLTVRLAGEVWRPTFDSVSDNGVFGARPLTVTAHDTLVAAARSQLGTRYLLGAERPGKALDCSALVKFVMAVLRIDVPRTAREQATQGVEVARDVNQLRPGDLLTFGRRNKVSHIGVYVGQGRFVHASTSRKQVVEASIDEPDTWFRRNWVGVRRLLAVRETKDSVAFH